MQRIWRHGRESSLWCSNVVERVSLPDARSRIDDTVNIEEENDQSSAKTMNFHLKNNAFVATNLHWMENWNSLNMDLRTLQRTPLNSFPSYSSLYHPYNGFSMPPYQSYFDFHRYVSSQLTIYPYATFHPRYGCYDSKDCRSSLFGKQTIFHRDDFA